MCSAQVISAEVAFQEQPFIKPLILSTGAIHRISQATATVRVRANGIEAIGYGSIYLSGLWAWPDPRWSHEQRDALPRELTVFIASHLQELTSRESIHPLELGLRLHHAGNHLDDPRFAQIPVLARSMCLSPFDAAFHDATGIAFNRSAFRLYDRPSSIPSADVYFAQGATPAIASTIRTSPVQSLPAWLIVGKNDDLRAEVEPWIRDKAYRCFKLKIMGRDNDADVQRTVEVFNAVRGCGVETPQLTIDSNEANPDAQSVLDYLLRLRKASPEAFDAPKYIEQPTGRDIMRSKYDWSQVTSLKPVLLDEGLTDLSLLEESARQGWSGFALKTCKGHSFALLAAAWGKGNGMIISFQDLTNPGHAMIQAALLGAYLPTINEVELNSPQFTPSANEPWLARYAGLFLRGDGMHQIAAGTEVGLGSIKLGDR